MSYTGFLFLLFLGASAALYRFCPVRLRPSLLLILSYAFYLTWVPMAAVLLAALTGVAFFAARTSGSRLAPAVTVLLVTCLMAFKIALLTPTHGIAGLIMPLGIS